jgi:fructose-bisphosphate aldolase, class I
LQIWAKDINANVAEAQKTVAQRAKENGLAALGKWGKVA